MNKIKDILSNLTGVSVGTWVRLILMLLSLVNVTLGAFGIAPLKFSEDELYTAVSIVLTTAIGLLSFWKNNSFTQAAQAADDYMHELKMSCSEAQEDCE